MDIRDKIIEFIRLKGPILPVQIAKEIGSNILMASAHLSELTATKKLKVSNVKFGSSPLYYLPGQEPRLQQFSSNLQEKEKRAYDLLGQKKILRDSELEPLMRVAMRAIKDFAVPLQVDHQGSKDIFWKWFLLSAQEAETIIKSQLKPIKTETPQAEAPAKEIQKTIKEIEKKEIPKKEETPVKDSFFNEIQDYFNKNKINTIEKNIIRKNSEITFIVDVPSTVGSLRYFCVAKSKKRINDGDLSSAYIQAQSKKLPVLFLTKGELTKNAKEILEKEFKGMSINKI